MSGNHEGSDPVRRKLLAYGVAGLSCVGLVATGAVFVEALRREPFKPLPRRWTHREAVEDLAPGEPRAVNVAGRLVYILRRSPEVVEQLRRPNAELRDPRSEHSAQSTSFDPALRSLRPDLFVAFGQCTHLGCNVRLARDPDLARTFPATCGSAGCFFCPCHGSVFDLAGRVVDSAPAPRNLDVPDYQIDESGAVVFAHGAGP